MERTPLGYSVWDVASLDLIGGIRVEGSAEEMWTAKFMRMSLIESRPTT